MTVSATVEYWIFHGPDGQIFHIEAGEEGVAVPTWAEPFIPPLDPDVTIDV